RFLVHQLGRSIGNRPGVPGPACAAEDDEPLEVRQRFRNGEAALNGRQRGAEEIVRDLVAAPRLSRERGRGPVEALVVVGRDLARTRGRLANRLTVSAVRDARV